MPCGGLQLCCSICFDPVADGAVARRQCIPYYAHKAMLRAEGFAGGVHGGLRPFQRGCWLFLPGLLR